MLVFQFKDHIIDYDVEFQIIPEAKGIDRFENGDPGYPGEPSHCEIISVKYHISQKEVPNEVFNILEEEIEKECWNLHQQLLNEPI